MSGRMEDLALAEFTIRVLANVRHDLRTGATFIPAELAAGRYTVATARTACRSLGTAIGETLRKWRDNFRPAADARVLSILGLTGAKLTAAASELVAGVQHFRQDPAGSEAEIDALCASVLADVPAADDASDAAGTRFKRMAGGVATELMGT